MAKAWHNSTVDWISIKNSFFLQFVGLFDFLIKRQESGAGKSCDTKYCTFPTHLMNFEKLNLASKTNLKPFALENKGKVAWFSQQ